MLKITSIQGVNKDKTFFHRSISGSLTTLILESLESMRTPSQSAVLNKVNMTCKSLRILCDKPRTLCQVLLIMWLPDVRLSLFCFHLLEWYFKENFVVCCVGKLKLRIESPCWSHPPLDFDVDLLPSFTGDFARIPILFAQRMID